MMTLKHFWNGGETDQMETSEDNPCQTSRVNAAHGRLVINRNKTDLDGEINRIVLDYPNRGIEAAYPSDLLRALESFFELDLPTIQLAWRYKPSLGDLVKQTGALFRDNTLSLHTVEVLCETGTCACALLPPQFRNNNSGHLHTTDSSWMTHVIGHDSLSDLFSQGLNHIPLAPIDLEEILFTNRSVAEILATQFLPHGQLNAEEAVRFAEHWTSCRQKEIEAYSHPDCMDTSSPTFRADIKKILDIAFVSGVDKAAGQAHFICRDYASLLVDKHLHSSPCFKVLDHDPTSDLCSSLLDLTSKFKTAEIPDKLPTLYPLFKPKKGNYRFITSTSATCYSWIGSLLHVIAVTILEHLLLLSDEKQEEIWRFHRLHVLLFGIITDFKECLANLPEVVYFDFSADVSQCYDSIPTQSDIPDNLSHILSQCINLILGYYKRHNRQRSPSFWIKCDKSGLPCSCILSHTVQSGVQLSLDEVRPLQCTVITGMYIKAGPYFVQQVLGVPQGISPGPDWTNIYLWFFEFTFLCKTCCSASGRSALDQFPFTHWYRFIDDIRILNNSRAADLLSEVYPSCLKLEPTCQQYVSHEVQSITTFLDIRSTLLRFGSLHCASLFKHETLPFKPVMFIKHFSNRPILNSYNVLCGLTFNAVLHNSTEASLLKALHFFVTEFHSNGFNRTKCLNTIKKFLTRSNFPFTFFDLKPILWKLFHR
jgi:hypothetical protein